MSIKLMSAIFDTEFRDLQDAEGNTTKASTAKFVTLALADHANDEGEGAYPSLDTLARKTSLTRQCVINTLDALKFNGIATLVGSSRRGTSNYTINTACFPRMDDGSKPRLLVNPVDYHQSTEITPPVNPVDPNHTLTIIKPSSKGGLSEKEIQQANDKVTFILENEKKVKYQNRDKLPDPYLSFADLYNQLTGQEPTKRSIQDWMMTFEEWKQEGLQSEHIRAAYEHATRPEGGFPVGRPGALTNTAVAMKTKMRVKPAIEEDNSPEAHNKRVYEMILKDLSHA